MAAVTKRPDTMRERRTALVRSCLARAALFRLLARGFAYPGPGHAAAMRQAFRDLDGPLERGVLPRRLGARVRRARRAWRAADDGSLGADYLRLFHGSEGMSLRETGYGDGRRLGGGPVEAADISGFYLAFGFGLSESDPAPPDHIGAELEFTSLVLIKETYARLRGWIGRERIAREAAKAFLEYHLGRWAGELARRVVAAGAPAPYCSLAELTEAAVATECGRLGARPSLTTGQVPFDPLQAASFTCPMEPGSPIDRAPNAPA